MVLRSRKRILVFHPHQPMLQAQAALLNRHGYEVVAGFGNTDGSQIAGPGRFFRFAIG